MIESPNLLDVRNLSVRFDTRHGAIRAIDNVSFTVAAGEMLGVVGESGSGKSVSSYAVLGLLDDTAKITGGEIRFDGADLLKATKAELRRLRGASISMVFQNPRTALNQVRTIGQQLTDVVMAHQSLGHRAAKVQALEALRSVKITDPVRRFDAYPFELSGGMCQRVMIALALACSPKLLIADEPTTGLDVTTQSSIMELIAELQRIHGMAVLFITHDLLLASDYCQRTVVMHAGQVVESASAEQIFERPRHPYTMSLMRATLRPDTEIASLVPVPGAVPDLRRSDLPACRFAGRCRQGVRRCEESTPPILEIASGHRVACWEVA